MKLKKIPFYLFLLLFTVGASLIIGFLSFSGMYALFPLLLVSMGIVTVTLIPTLIASISAFVLSVAYEGEIYFQNLKGAYEKLMKPDYIRDKLATDFLRANFPNTKDPDCPQFFKDYEILLRKADEYAHKRLFEVDKKKKKLLEQKLKDMERLFAEQLFPKTKKSKTQTNTTYAAEIQNWFKDENWFKDKKKPNLDELQEKLEKRQTIDLIVRGFGLTAGVFMTLAIPYLLVEAVTVLPFLAAIPFATLPYFIVPMAIVCGAAYAFLIYNALSDMIDNNIVRKWYKKITDDLKDGKYLRGLSIAFFATVLTGFAIGLTICTAGTWWTIAKNSPPLFAFLAKIPPLVMAGVNSTVLGIAQFVFNLENINESLELLVGATKIKLSKLAKNIVQGAKHLVANENPLQLVNPFRIALKLTIVPLRLLLFTFHLISIGVTADRMPGVPAPFTALLGIICEGFEDLHYFLGDLLHKEHHHAKDTKHLLKERFGSGHSHDHSNDLPTFLLKLVFSPLYFAAATYDWATSKLGKNKLSWLDAWDKQHGRPHKEKVESEIPDTTSLESKKEQAAYKIDHYIDKHLAKAKLSPDVRDKKIEALDQFKQDILKTDFSSEEDFIQRIKEETQKGVYSQARFFNPKTTRTVDFVESLSHRVASAA